ncbi:MAG: Glu-tRNA(Gln) amidotransferase subunit GatE, partial [Candidatus Heimdallarchaeota archaeon]|nr:Glu-tRNA(Gln) amidotransferase subunit GatE [Candidatus Heimdallarchaeota archaeon]
LGIPLIEIATGPDIRSPEEAKETALRIGELLRTTGFVKRGQGTIRQDLNVSIKKGTRIEIKGVSDLDLLTTYVTNESIRQVRMLEFLDILDKRGFELSHINKILSKDVSTLFVKCTAKFISKAIKNGDSVIAANLPYFNDLLGFELQPDYRVGTELSEICKVTAGLGGILHSDELPKFGISEDEVNAVRKQLKTKDTDGFILLVGKQNLCNLGIDGIKNVMKLWFEHKAIIPEVRSPKNNGTTGYLRPLPGKARMYPETDAKPIHLSKELLARIDSTKFEMPEERLNRYIKKIKLSKELADQMVLHPQNNLFEEIVNSYKVDANLVANTMLSTIINLRRDNFNVDAISENHLRSVFKLISLNEITKDAIEPILVEICKVGSNAKVENIISQLGIEKLDESEIEKVIDEVMSQHKDVISEKGMGAMGVLMGLIMNQFAGKADGKIVSGIIRKKIQNPK